jgi:hypothetical protein
VATDLDQILSGVTGRRAMDGKDYLIDQPAFRPKNFAKMLHVRFELRWRLFAMEDFVCYLNCIRAGDANKRNSAFPGRSRDGSDGVRNGHTLANCRATGSVAKLREQHRFARAQSGGPLPLFDRKFSVCLLAVHHFV